jgi:hypothetical protein
LFYHSSVNLPKRCFGSDPDLLGIIVADPDPVRRPGPTDPDPRPSQPKAKPTIIIFPENFNIMFKI